MPVGMLVNRQWIFVLKNGTIVLDWGNGLGVDLMHGEFSPLNEKDFSHSVQDDELEILKRMGRITSYDKKEVHIISLPEPPRTTVS